MRKKLGEILVETGAASSDDVESALAEQSAGEPNRLGDLLVANGKLSPKDLARALSSQYKLPYVELPSLPQALIDLVPLELQLQFRFVPLEQKDTELTIAMADLANLEVVATLEQTWTKVHVCVAASDEIDALHATLSGLFISPVPPAPSPMPSRASPKAEDLFGDLNLDSSSTGIPVKPAPIAPLTVEERADAASAEALFGDLNLSSTSGIDRLPPPVPAEPAKAPEEEPVVDGEPAENSGAISVPGPKEGTGSILAMLADGGTGPVVDTPFKSDVSVGALVPSQPLPFSTPTPAKLEAPAETSSPPGPALPDWLGESSPSAIASAWTGALDHLAPSKLVVGLTRALLAKGIVTEEEILAALGGTKK